MAQTCLPRRGTTPHFVSHDRLLTVDDLRLVAADPALRTVAGDYARRFYPRSTLARVA